MNVVELRGAIPRGTRPGRTSPLFAITFLLLAGPFVAAAAEPAAKKSDDDADDDDVISLTAYNVKADRIEDFGFRVENTTYNETARPNAVTFWFSKFAPLITEVVPNTAAAKAGLQPGERILKSDGRSTTGGPFSTGKFGQWSKTQKKKWAEVAAGKTNVTWTLEVEAPVTKAVRIVKLVVPTPPPRWGASVWQKPQGRTPATVTESGPLAERSRVVLDQGVWVLLNRFAWECLGQDVSFRFAPTGYEWYFGNAREGLHRIFVTQFRGRTDVVLETKSPTTGDRIYLTSPSGTLEKTWQWPARGKPGEIPTEEARAGFEHELDLWTTKVAKVSARWPFETIPGFDPNAIFAVLAPKDAAPAVTVAVARPVAAEFLKLRLATETERALFTDACAKLGAEQDHWAYTETSRGLEDKRVIVTRVDPSKPEAERSVLLSIDGKSPTPADVQRWRDDGGDIPKALGDLPPLASIVDWRELRIHQDGDATVVFEVPIRSDNADFPAEKFQAHFRVHQAHRAFEEIAVKLRDSFRVAGVVNVTEAGLAVRFQTLDPALAPQPVQLKAGGGVRVLLVKISRSFEVTRADFKRVVPFEETAVPAK